MLSADVTRVPPLILILYWPQYGIEVTTASHLSVQTSGVFLGAGVLGVLGWRWGGTHAPFWASCSFGRTKIASGDVLSVARITFLGRRHKSKVLAE